MNLVYLEYGNILQHWKYLPCKAIFVQPGFGYAQPLAVPERSRRQIL